MEPTKEFLAKLDTLRIQCEDMIVRFNKDIQYYKDSLPEQEDCKDKPFVNAESIDEFKARIERGIRISKGLVECAEETKNDIPHIIEEYEKSDEIKADLLEGIIDRLIDWSKQR